jgi:hypothetical protein
MVFAKLKNFFVRLIFFPPKFFFAQKDFLFLKIPKKKFWREKNQLSKKSKYFKSHQKTESIIFSLKSFSLSIVIISVEYNDN